jgi:Na+/H+-dicarboxylate symporter
VAKRLTYFILAGLVLGIIVGWALNFAIDDGTPAAAAKLKTIGGYITILSQIFLHLIKMIIAPLVFATLVAGIAHMGDTAALGRVGVKAVGWFICASLFSLTLGLILVNFFQPGSALGLPLPPVDAASGVDRSAFDFSKFVLHIFPESMVSAMAGNEILQIVVFSLFVGVAITAIGE